LHPALSSFNPGRLLLSGFWYPRFGCTPSCSAGTTYSCSFNRVQLEVPPPHVFPLDRDPQDSPPAEGSPGNGRSRRRDLVFVFLCRLTFIPSSFPPPSKDRKPNTTCNCSESYPVLKPEILFIFESALFPPSVKEIPLFCPFRPPTLKNTFSPPPLIFPFLKIVFPFFFPRFFILVFPNQRAEFSNRPPKARPAFFSPLLLLDLYWAPTSPPPGFEIVREARFSPLCVFLPGLPLRCYPNVPAALPPHLFGSCFPFLALLKVPFPPFSPKLRQHIFFPPFNSLPYNFAPFSL